MLTHLPFAFIFFDVRLCVNTLSEISVQKKSMFSVLSL